MLVGVVNFDEMTDSLSSKIPSGSKGIFNSKATWHKSTKTALL